MLVHPLCQFPPRLTSCSLGCLTSVTGIWDWPFGIRWFKETQRLIGTEEVNRFIHKMTDYLRFLGNVQNKRTRRQPLRVLCSPLLEPLTLGTVSQNDIQWQAQRFKMAFNAFKEHLFVHYKCDSSQNKKKHGWCVSSYKQCVMLAFP